MPDTAILGSNWFWIFIIVAGIALAITWGLTALVDYIRERRERIAYSAAAYQQLHDRQEFRRIVEQYGDEEL